MNDFLFELGCEELPPFSVLPLGRNLAEKLTQQLNTQLDSSAIKVNYFATPRRLALLISNLPDNQPSLSQCKKGPSLGVAYDKHGHPTQALLGFIKACGISVNDLTVAETDKGKWLQYEYKEAVKSVKDLLPGLINQALKALPVAKMMRWGSQTVEFIRPVHWVVMLWNQEIISAEVLGLKANNLTYGHRFHHPQAIRLSSPNDYEAILFNAKVIANFEERKQIIIEQINGLAKKRQALVILSERLLEEVTAIVEWPQAILADFSAEYLSLPKEVLIASMQQHQKCFALQDSQGKLLPCFITIANIESLKVEQIKQGNEKVMQARLNDAAFFYHHDRKRPLIDYYKDTDKVIYQAKLGSLYNKSLRIEKIIDKLASDLNVDKKSAFQAVALSKCDLLTGMVKEFPELEGLMGYYYALADGQDLDVAQAIYEQYLPRFSKDKLPESILGKILSLADRLDTIVGIFAIGQKPTAIKDPFKLRRHALAIVRLLLTIEAKISISDFIELAAKNYGDLAKSVDISAIQSFILERLYAYYQEQKIDKDKVASVLAKQSDDLYDFDQRLQGLMEFIQLPQAPLLIKAAKRVRNVIHNKKIDYENNEIQPLFFQHNIENLLFNQIKTVEILTTNRLLAKSYSSLFLTFAEFEPIIQEFFDSVMIMVEDQAIRTNRLQLIYNLDMLLNYVADFSLVQSFD